MGIAWTLRQGIWRCWRKANRRLSFSVLKTWTSNPAVDVIYAYARERSIAHFSMMLVRDVIKAMEEADFITYFVPNFSLQVPGGLKTLFDRLAYVFHRPRMFGKCSSSFVVQGVYGGAKIVSYLREVMDAWGSNVVKGSVFKGGLKRSDIHPSTCKTDRIMLKTIQQMEKKLLSKPYPKPTIFKLMIFRMTRSFMKFSEEATPVDRKCFQDQGWSDSEYFYPVRLGLLKKVLGKLFDKMAIKMCKKK
jgi:hypothetical protein